MFGQVWKWAGRYRMRETNIGISPPQIPTVVRTLIYDTRTWVETETYDADELAVRSHHRLVQIHPFPNVNGRHGRIAKRWNGPTAVRSTNCSPSVAIEWGVGATPYPPNASPRWPG